MFVYIDIFVMFWYLLWCGDIRVVIKGCLLLNLWLDLFVYKMSLFRICSIYWSWYLFLFVEVMIFLVSVKKNDLVVFNWEMCDLDVGLFV